MDAIRQDNIARNNELLKALGLLNDTPSVSRTRTKAKKRKEVFKVTDKSTQRRSFRLQNLTPSIKTESKITSIIIPKVKHVNSISTWSTLFLNDIECNSFTKWDKHKMHQHLELSESCLTVATTGCAGYGGVLTNTKDSIKWCQSKLNTSTNVITRWKIKVLSLGIGGFAVGVAFSNLSAPIKSLGNRPDSWVLHSSGHLMHNRKCIHSIENCCINADDEIEVIINAKGVLLFNINGTEYNTAVTLPYQNYVLCCQPYMGGAARLL
jgi:hypothetical protein